MVIPIEGRQIHVTPPPADWCWEQVRDARKEAKDEADFQRRVRYLLIAAGVLIGGYLAVAHINSVYGLAAARSGDVALLAAITKIAVAGVPS